MRRGIQQGGVWNVKKLKVFGFIFHLNIKEERKKRCSKRSCVRYGARMLHDEQKSTLYRNQDNPVSIFSFFSGWLPNNQFEQLYPLDRSHRYYLQHGTVKGPSSQHFSNVTPTYRSIARYNNSVALERNQLGITTISSHRKRRSVAPMPPVLQALPLTHHLKPKVRTLESQKLPACQSIGNTKRTIHCGHRSEEWGPREPFIHNSSLPVRSSQGRHRDHRPSILNKHHRSKSCLENCNDRGHQKQQRYLSLLWRLPPQGFTSRLRSNEDIFTCQEGLLGENDWYDVYQWQIQIYTYIYTFKCPYTYIRYDYK